MSPLNILIISTLFIFIGVALGILTGLIPGLHVNTISFLIVASQAALIVMISDILVSYQPGTMDLLAILSSMVMALLVTHTFLNFIPATYFGAPEGETALSVLPAHELMLDGKGFEAIKASALGSFGAAILSLLFILPARLLMGSPVNLYEKMSPYIPYILIVVVAILVLKEGRSLLDHRPKLMALGVFFLSGLLGFIVLTPGGMYSQNWFPYKQDGVSPASLMLFPLFTGLFGISTLLVSLMDDPDVPEQKTEGVEVELENKNKLRGVLNGTFSGGLVGWLPGITAAVATAVSKIFSGEEDKETETREYIVAVSAVDTSCAIFTLVALFVILKARSGAMQALFKINQGNVHQWSQIFHFPSLMALLLYSVILASTIAFFLTLYLGKFFSNVHKKVEYGTISRGIIVFLIIMIFFFTGPMGLFVGLVSSSLGLIPPLVGLKRVHMMGCLIFPIILFLLGLDGVFLSLLGM